MARQAKDSRIGRRVEIAPHYDLWMRGARFGTVTGITHWEGREVLRLKMDHPQVKRPAKVYADDVTYL